MNVSLIVRDKITRQCPQSTTFEEKGKPKRYWTEVPLLTSLAPYRRAKPAHKFQVLKAQAEIPPAADRRVVSKATLMYRIMSGLVEPSPTDGRTLAAGLNHLSPGQLNKLLNCPPIQN